VHVRGAIEGKSWARSIFCLQRWWLDVMQPASGRYANVK
jgi:hypothetical protein